MRHRRLISLRQIIRFAHYQWARPNDFILATMQSAGTHWLRFMIAKAIVDYFKLDYEFNSIRPLEIVPGFSLHAPDYFTLNSRYDIPRVQHTHLPCKFPFTIFFKGKKIMLLVRDLRDALASHYRKHLRATGQFVSFEDFLRDTEGTIRKQSVAGTLEQRVEFLNTWGYFHKRYPQRVLVVKYEDLRLDPAQTLKRVLDFLGMEDVSDGFLAEVVKFSSLENMKRIEKKGKTQEAASVYKGIVGGYKEAFDQRSLAYFTSYVKKHLRYTFGYQY